MLSGLTKKYHHAEREGMGRNGISLFHFFTLSLFHFFTSRLGVIPCPRSQPFRGWASIRLAVVLHPPCRRSSATASAYQLCIMHYELCIMFRLAKIAFNKFHLLRCQQSLPIPIPCLRKPIHQLRYLANPRHQSVLCRSRCVVRQIFLCQFLFT